MKNLNLYINEALVTSKPTGVVNIHNTYCPKTKKELIENIKTELSKGNTNLNCIDTSHITDMSQLFDNVRGVNLTDCGGNIDIYNWDVSNVTNMSFMFYDCDKFDCDISNWNVSNVENMSHMFCGCKNFTCSGNDLSKWDTRSVQMIACVFNGCENLDFPVEQWNLKNVKIKNTINAFVGSKMFRKYVGTKYVYYEIKRGHLVLA